MIVNRLLTVVQRDKYLASETVTGYLGRRHVVEDFS